MEPVSPESGNLLLKKNAEKKKMKKAKRPCQENGGKIKKHIGFVFGAESKKSRESPHRPRDPKGVNQRNKEEHSREGASATAMSIKRAWTQWGKKGGGKRSAGLKKRSEGGLSCKRKELVPLSKKIQGTSTTT